MIEKEGEEPDLYRKEENPERESAKLRRSLKPGEFLNICFSQLFRFNGISK